MRSGRIRQLRRGHFTSEPDADPVLAARAAAMACEGSVISHRSAALVHGLPLLHPPPRRTDLTVQPRRTGDVAGALLHRAGLPSEDIQVIDGAEVTSVPRTVIDLGRALPLDAAVVTMDAALHLGRTDEHELRAVLHRCRAWPNARRAAAALRLSDPRAESPLESVSRLVLPRLGLPMPRPQAVIRDRRGVQIGRCDFYWDDVGVFGEADGHSKYGATDEEVRTAILNEKLRHEDLENLGLFGARWGWRDARYVQQKLATRIRNARERGRRRDASGFPRLWSVDDD